MTIFNTKQVSKLLGISLTKLQRALWDGRIDPLPQKTPAGNFIWQIDDINRASWVLCRRAFEPSRDLLAEAVEANEEGN